MINIRILAIILAILVLAGCSARSANQSVSIDSVSSQKTLKTAESFLQAAGSGDGKTLDALMADDFVWKNEGDSRIPWIGVWQGKEVVFNQFMPAFGAGLKVTSWKTEFSFAQGEHAVFMGTMSADAIQTGKSTGIMNWAVRVQVIDGKVKSWVWFEDSYAVSAAFHDN